MKYFLGIDVSTTATKSLLVDARGAVIGAASEEYAYQTPHPLWSEQDPAVWWDAVRASVRHVINGSGIDGSDICGVGLTGQMHGLVLLDEKGDVLRPAILWNDQRTGPQCDRIRERFGRERFIQVSGNDPVTSFTLPKVFWVQEHEPHIWEKTRYILLPKDYIRYMLSGAFAMDRAGGSGTIMFDIAKRDWSPEILSVFDIPEQYLPGTFEGTEITSAVSEQAAEELGIREGIFLSGGGGDQQAAAVGTGAVREGIVSVSIGTSGVVFAAADKPCVDPAGRLDTFCHSLPGMWNLMGVMLSAGGSLRWYRDTYQPGVSYDDLLHGIDQVQPGCKGIFFLPYLTGERTPYADPLARGAFVGLTIRHDAKSMVRAVVEGICFGLKDCFELIKAAGVENVNQVRVTGGGAKSAVWRQMLADILNCDVVKVNATEGAAYGAALTALVAGGEFPSLEEACDQTIQVVDTITPDRNAGAYADLYPVYQDLYPALKDIFARIGKSAG